MYNEKIVHDYKIGLKTISKSTKLKKWIYHKTALLSLLNIRKAIEIISVTNPKYFDILSVTLGSILLQFSNVFRDGKALKYRENWKIKPTNKKIFIKCF